MGSSNLRLDELDFAGRSRRLVGSAVHRSSMWSQAGLSERTFSLAFSNLVYPQIWEDPVVDMEAMALAPGHTLVAIASGGCNILSYLTAAPVEIKAVDLNAAHVALNKLKWTALSRLPSYAAFFDFFGRADLAHNAGNYEDYIRQHLDDTTRAYWSGRDVTGRRRIERFTRGFYRFGLLGRFIATAHLIARMHGANPAHMLDARSREEQKEIFERELRPLFDSAIVKAVLARKSSLFGLGIPPSQYDALSEGRSMHDVVLERLERLACGFDLATNYFAWQAFGRGYAASGQGPVPPYLEAANYELLRKRVGGLEIENISFTQRLTKLPERSVDRYSLLDAQDWMTDDDLADLWREIGRTARPGARVIFRTAGTATILPGRVPPDVLGQWTYCESESNDFTARDRSAIYGGFHLYVRSS